MWLNPPPIPLTTRRRWTGSYGQPYARRPTRRYGEARIPAWDMIRFSINIMRGCFGGCTFCSITEHEGRIIQSRSEASILKGDRGNPDQDARLHRHHLGPRLGPTANMYRMACKDQKDRIGLPPPFLRVSPASAKTWHRPRPADPALPQGAGDPGRQKVLIGSGLRYDLAVRSPEYVKELVTPRWRPPQDRPPSTPGWPLDK